jgi:hypothetical protein
MNRDATKSITIRREVKNSKRSDSRHMNSSWSIHPCVTHPKSRSVPEQSPPHFRRCLSLRSLR